MKTTILSCLLISLLMYGYCTNTKRDKIRILNDSISNAISNFQLHDDTIMLSRILPLCDSLIILDNSKMKYSHILRKCQILTMLDRYEEALVEREKATNLLPPNDASRLEFYGFKYKLSGDTLQSNEYFLRALAECDKQIANNENLLRKISYSN